MVVVVIVIIIIVVVVAYEVRCAELAIYLSNAH